MNSANAIEGSIRSVGMPGMNASTAPPSARKAGYGAPTRRAMAARTTAASRTPSRDSKPVMTGIRLPVDPPTPETDPIRGPVLYAVRASAGRVLAPQITSQKMIGTSANSSGSATCATVSAYRGSTRVAKALAR